MQPDCSCRSRRDWLRSKQEPQDSWALQMRRPRPRELEPKTRCYRRWPSGRRTLKSGLELGPCASLPPSYNRRWHHARSQTAPTILQAFCEHKVMPAAVSDFSKPCFACPSQDMQLSRFIAVMVAEVGKMKRSAVGQSQARVIEHELDMRRAEFSPVAAPSRIGKFVRRLITGSNAVASPMRSVDRKLEDQYPSGNRQT
jgi:hypothetical protein